MFLVRPTATFEPVGFSSSKEVYQFIEKIGRTCYKSESGITDNSSTEFVKMILMRGHLSVLEHVSLTARIILDRGISHELVRHRLASYSQESTRYCNYKKDGNLIFVAPHWLLSMLNSLPLEEITFKNVDTIVSRMRTEYFTKNKTHISNKEKERIIDFLNICMQSELYYLKQVDAGHKPEDARGGLVHHIKTEIVMTANLRNWLHVFSLRTSKFAHPDMREIMNMLYSNFMFNFPTVAQFSEMERGKKLADLIVNSKKQISMCNFKDKYGNDLEDNRVISDLFKTLSQEYGEYLS